jgi:hypothetical protein
MRWGPGIAALLLIAPLALGGCARGTAKLSTEQEQRIASEGIVRRADDVSFTFSHDLGSSRSGREDRQASILVTAQSVLIHDNERVLLEITPRSTGEYHVSRDHDRISLGAGSGKSRRSWSFRPPDDAAGWTTDIRIVIHGTAGARS